MPIPTFNPPMRPSPGTSRTPEVNLRRASFGDGYGQNSPAGLNHIRQVVALRWEFLTLAEAQEIEAFLVERGGYQPFLYALNGEAQARRWICESWSMTDGHPSTVSATFKEWFGQVS